MLDRASSRRRAAAAACAAVLFATAAAAAPAAPAAKWRPTIVLVTLDTTRADHLGIYGYPRQTSPFIDSLARQGKGLPDEGALRRALLTKLGELRPNAPGIGARADPVTEERLRALGYHP